MAGLILLAFHLLSWISAFRRWLYLNIERGNCFSLRRQCVVYLLALGLSGCSTMHGYQASEIEGVLVNGQGIKVVFVSGNRIESKFKFVDQTTLGTTAGEFPLKDVEKVYVQEVDGGKTLVAIGIVVGIFALLINKVGEASGCAAAQQVGADC